MMKNSSNSVEAKHNGVKSQSEYSLEAYKMCLEKKPKVFWNYIFS